jgi:hypothetical protein
MPLLTISSVGEVWMFSGMTNRQFQLLVYACTGRWEVRYHIADNAEKIKMVAV